VGGREPAEGASQQESRAKRRAGLVGRQSQGFSALRDSLLRSHPHWDREDIENTAQSTMLVSPSVWSDERWFDPATQETQLRSLSCPTLIVRGEPDRGAIISDAAKQRIEELVPHGFARVTTIAGTGHVPQRDAFDLFVAVVLPFLTGQAAPDAEGGSPVCLLHLVDDQ
ncbi:MAG TPA: alpha/beta hydrolase, partial [Chloroflexota bacterium]|nr:alpha/beta hydrolase [Chloroflexota bacterium]